MGAVVVPLLRPVSLNLHSNPPTPKLVTSPLSSMLPETPVKKRKDRRKPKKTKVSKKEMKRRAAQALTDPAMEPMSKKAKAEKFRLQQGGRRRKGKKYGNSDGRDLRTLNKGVQKAIK